MAADRSSPALNVIVSWPGLALAAAIASSSVMPAPSVSSSTSRLSELYSTAPISVPTPTVL